MEDKRIKRYRDKITELSQENKELKNALDICNKKGLLKLINETLKMKNDYENLIKETLEIQNEYEKLVQEQKQYNKEYFRSMNG